jgi:polyisoprenoid-binding protein YceI
VPGPGYAVAAASRLTVKARSSIHDTVTVWDRVTGSVAVDPATIETAGAKATFQVDMTHFDAGDFIKNRKLRKDFEMDAHPTASFELTGLRDIVRDGEKLSAKADGVLRWRGREVKLVVAGTGTLTAAAIDVTGTFELDIRDLGMKAPRFLMFKMSDEVTVEVKLLAANSPA